MIIFMVRTSINKIYSVYIVINIIRIKKMSSVTWRTTSGKKPFMDKQVPYREISP